MRQTLVKKAVARKALRVGIGIAAVFLLLPLSALAVTPVDIDLKPENNENIVDPFNLGSSKPVEVAVLGSDDLPVFLEGYGGTINLGSLRLGDPTTGNDPLGLPVTFSETYQDINGDGKMDVIFDFGPARRFGDLGALNSGSVEVTLTGNAPVLGKSFQGTDAVRIVGGDGCAWVGFLPGKASDNRSIAAGRATLVSWRHGQPRQPLRGGLRGLSPQPRRALRGRRRGQAEPAL